MGYDFTTPPPGPDPFEKCKPPKGKVYQWVTTHVVGDPAPAARHLALCLEAGWKYVPKKRHPKFKSEHRTRIAFEGSVLMEMSRSKRDALAAAPINAAKEMDARYRQVMTVHGKNPSYPIVQDFPNFEFNMPSAAESGYVPVPKDAAPIDVDVTIKIRADAGWQDAAAVCAISLDEYVRRRVLIAHREWRAVMLLPVEGGSFDFIEKVRADV